MQKPLIGLLTSTLHDKDLDAERLCVSSRYVIALEAVADVYIVAILMHDKFDMSILQRMDGVLLTGGQANVNPDIYGGDYVLKQGEHDPIRDNVALEALKQAKDIGLPILGICRGLQEMNVYHGGTLKGDIHKQSEYFEHIKTYDEKRFIFDARHDIDIHQDSLLYNWYGDSKAYVNSAHGQAIDILGDGLSVEAVSPTDGIIEAIRIDNYPTFGYAVQWHPESKDVHNDDINKVVLQKFAQACTEYMNSKI